jgi:hypothetical protein
VSRAAAGVSRAAAGVSRTTAGVSRTTAGRQALLFAERETTSSSNDLTWKQ